MKKTSKLLLLLASLGMLIGCGPKGGAEPQPSDDPNQINVIYFKSYVSQERATAMKNAYVASLQTAGVEVDATKVNFFESTNSKVDGLVDEILRYNTKHPNNNVDVILGANGFSKVSDPDQKAKFEAIYVNDETNYTYGTSTKAEDNTNRKFWYNKDKLTNQYVAGLQTYLKANWTSVPEPVKTNKLVVMTYGTFVSETRMNAIETAFDSYLSAQSKSISTVEFVHESETTTIADFMGKVTEYDSNHPDAKVDVLIGLNADKDSAISSQGFQKDSTNYNYGDRASTAEKDYTQDNKERKLWFKPVDGSITVEEKLFQDYLLANWKTPEADYFLVGDMNEWSTTSTAYPLTKITDGEYKYENLEVTAGAAFKVYYPAGATDADKWFTNASTWDGCGFTLSNPDKNIVVTDAGKYTVNFFVTGENNNHITLEKPVDPAKQYSIAFYSKYIADETITALKSGIQAAFDAANIDKVVTEQKLSSSDNVGPAAYSINEGVKVLLGFNGDGNYTPEGGEEIKNVLATKGYYKFSEDFTYGKPGTNQSNRKLWVLDAEKEGVEATTIYNYLRKNWHAPEYYLIGSINAWAEADKDYKLDLKEEGVYTFSKLEVEAGAAIKVFCYQSNTYFNNATTYENCGYTISNDNDKNVVITDAGKYNITFYVESEYNNHIVLEKINEEEVAFTIGLYTKFVSSTRASAIESAFLKYLSDSSLTKGFDKIVFENLGTGNVATAANNVTTDMSVLIGFNGDGTAEDGKTKILASKGFVQYTEINDGETAAVNFTYGDLGNSNEKKNRKLWYLSSLSENTDVVNFINFLVATYPVQAA